MGEAKRRGTREERIYQVLERVRLESQKAALARAAQKAEADRQRAERLQLEAEQGNVEGFFEEAPEDRLKRELARRRGKSRMNQLFLTGAMLAGLNAKLLT